MSLSYLEKLGAAKNIGKKQIIMVDLLDLYPAVSDLEKKAQSYMPHFAWEQLVSGTGLDQSLHQNRLALDSLHLLPRTHKPRESIDLTTELFGKTYSVPFGIAPIGTTGLFRPDGEVYLAEAAARNQLPYCLSCVAFETPEIVGPLCNENGWFQIYPPENDAICIELLKRATESGFQVLVVTADVPCYGMRERARRAGLRADATINSRTSLQALMRPRWLRETLIRGRPTFKTILPYCDASTTSADFVLDKMLKPIDTAYIQFLREHWSGPILIKGIAHPEDAQLAISQGVDGVIVSNHGGRQFDASPATIETLEPILEVVNGRIKVIVDSGFTNGLDIAKALHLGADFVLIGRAFIYGIATLGRMGGDHVYRILVEDLKNNMHQLGVSKPAELRLATSIRKKNNYV